MEKIDIGENFPCMNGGDGVILSKRGDICIGWEVVFPAAFRCNEEKYDSIVHSLAAAVMMLPDYAIVHKQDVFMRKSYNAEDVTGFFQEAYERHFDGRTYFDHKCRVFLTLSNKSNVKNANSGIMGILSSKNTLAISVISNALSVADQFEAVLGSGGLITLNRLTESDIFGGDDKPGIIQDYLNFTDSGRDVLSDIAIASDRVRVGDKMVVCHLIADLEQLPGEVASCRKVSSLSTENSVVNLSFLHDIGQGLDCEHIVNQFIVKEPSINVHGALDRKRRLMQSMSFRSAENRKYAEEINEYLEEAATRQVITVRSHINILSGGRIDEIEVIKDKVTTAILKLGITPVYNISNAPVQYWSSIPGNESGLAYDEYMTMELNAALCVGLYDGFDIGIRDGVMKMSDRQKLVPVRFDIQEKALENGLIENYNVFLLGPSGSGKSFFMNKYLQSCYAAGQHCFLIDVGDSYRALCHIIKEESNGEDGTYYTFEKGKPISFNPFRSISRFRQTDSEAMNFLFTLMCTLWKNGGEPISSSGLKFVRDSVGAFVGEWNSSEDPVFNDYFLFVRDKFSIRLKDDEIGKEYFDIKDYLISLEQFYDGGPYDYLLNSKDSADILNDRFVVFEIDHIKGDPIVYPITTLVIMDAFMEKMYSNGDFKVMCIEEAWKAMMGTQMATYMLELWKTARKHRTSAVVVTQELKDITSSPVIRDSIVENSAVKILLDQTKYINRFEELASALSLNEDDKAMVLSLNRLQKPGVSGREVFFSLGNKKSFVMRLEVSEEERIALSSQKRDKMMLAKETSKTRSYIKAIEGLVAAPKGIKGGAR